MERMLVRMQGMREFINEILDVATLEKEGLKRELVAVDAAPLINQVAEDSSWLARDKQIELAFRGAAGLPPILAAPPRFVQVLQNLVTNAIKFTPPGGAVTVTVEPRADDVHFAVRDTGTGISKEDVRHVFTEFYRVKNVTQDGVPGSGLGLSIVKAIVSAHGGAVWVESEVGRGSTFHFTVQRAPAGAAAAAPLSG
jgi:two-component system phosphate regulon sensor histidine kinase PhoR